MTIDKTYGASSNNMRAGAAEWDVGGKLNVNSGGTLTMEAGSTAVLNAGAGAATMGFEGNASMQQSLTGVGNTADTTDDVLFTYSLPASSFDVAGRALTVTAFGKLAANGNNKRMKIWFGATAVADSGVVTGNGVGWQLQADIAKVGAAGANTQIGQGQSIVGTTHGGVNVPQTPTETESGAIVIKVTGASGTTGAANDVLGQFFQVNFQN